MKLSKKQFKNLVNDIAHDVEEYSTEFINLEKSDIEVHLQDGGAMFFVHDLKVNKKGLKAVIADAIVNYFEMLDSE